MMACPPGLVIQAVPVTGIGASVGSMVGTSVGGTVGSSVGSVVGVDAVVGCTVSPRVVPGGRVASGEGARRAAVVLVVTLR